MKRGIPCFFVSSHGRWRGTLTPDNNLNADRRIRQYEQGTDPAFTIRVAWKLVYAKIRNSRRVHERFFASHALVLSAPYYFLSARTLKKRCVEFVGEVKVPVSELAPRTV